MSYTSIGTTTVPELNTITTLQETDLIPVHDGTELKTTTFETLQAEVLSPIYNETDAEWKTLPLSEGITAGTIGGTTPPKYRKVGDRVDIAGSIIHTWSGSITQLATLPEGFRPTNQFTFLAPISTASGQGGLALLYVTSAGALMLAWVKALGGTNITTERAITLTTSFYII